jgi:hypothetical protein
VEHLSFSIPETGFYGLRVGYGQNTFANFANWGSATFPQTYGLAWNGTAFSTLYWNAAGSGVWNGVDANWTTSSNGTGGTARSATTPYSTLVVGSGGYQSILVEGAREAAGLVLSNGTATFSGNSSPSLSVGAGGIHLASTADGDATFESSLPIQVAASQAWSNASAHDLVFNGEISGAGDLEIAASSAGAVVWNGNHTRTGNTTVGDGLLVVNGDTSPGGVTTVSSGGAVGGSGTLSGLLLEEGGTLAPGNSPGTLHIDGNATWQGGGHYNWQVFSENPDAADQSLAGTGWDFIDIAGTLTLSGFDTSANRFHLNLWTLSGIAPDQNGPVGGFDPAVGSTWLIARADGGIILNSVSLLANTDYTGYFSIHTSPFNGTAGWAGALPQGGFRIFTMAEPIGLYLSANPTGVPEPNQLAASVFLLAGAGIGALIKRRCSKKRGLWIIHKKP